MTNRPNVVILGGGITGLVCAYAFCRYPVNIRIIEPGIIGDDILSNEFKCIQDKTEVVTMFKKLDLPYSKYYVRGGIMLRGQVINYPDEFIEKLSGGEKDRIRLDYFRKTRFAEPENWTQLKGALTEPISTKDKGVLRTDSKMFVEALFDYMVEKGNRAIRAFIDSIGLRTVNLNNGVLPYDYLILTIPLWTIRRLAYWNVPHGMSIATNVIKVTAKYGGIKRWEFVYTPYTPGGAIHKVSTLDGDFYYAEVNGDLNSRVVDICSDLNFIFKDAWYIEEIHEKMSGYLLPLILDPGEEVYWPENVAPVGTYAQWDSNCTVDSVLKTAIKVSDRWFG